jgi:hypothetical protein
MTLFLRHGALICLAAVACLFVSTAARAETREEKKRAFAELLAKRTKAEKAHAAKPDVAAKSQLAKVAPKAVTDAGLPPASPTAPSGFGFGRDAYVQALYPIILNRDATAPEVDFWASRLVHGVEPYAVAEAIFRSQEHRAEIANGTANGVTLKQAYRSAIAFGNAHKFGPLD